MYPGGQNIHIPWKQAIEMIEYNPDPNFNTYTTSSDPAAVHYSYAFETSRLQRNGNIWPTDAAASWVDANNRHQVVYQGGTPTNLGVNVNYRIRQFTLNHANMNDFIALELELTNTGVLDVDGDGTPEKTDNKINALVLNLRDELINSMSNSLAGRRGASGWFTGPVSGYDASPDAEGHPWDVPVTFTGPSPSTLDQTQADGAAWASDGKRMLGNTMRRRANYYDVYTGAQWIAAKQGALPSEKTASSTAREDKQTIFHSHGVGTGAQRGWFTSVSKGYGNNDHDAWTNHTLSMGAFYQEGGKTLDKTAFVLLPDPNWFRPHAPGYRTGQPADICRCRAPRGPTRATVRRHEVQWHLGTELGKEQPRHRARRLGYRLDRGLFHRARV